MANLATKAPNFTSETARAAQLKSAASRKLNLEREKLALATELPDDDLARKNRTLKQIDGLDKLIDDALVRGQEKRFKMLCDTKERLWKLVQPTAGVVKHRGSSRQQQVSQPIPTPQENQPEPTKT